METWTPDKIWEKLFASSPQIEWIHFRARIDYLPRKSLVFSFPGKEYYCLNLKPTLARGFKKWMTEKDSSSNVLIVKRERFTFLLSYFEPIIHEIGSYNNPENVDLGFTLENIAQTLNLPAFIAKDDSEQIATDLSGQELVPGNHRYRLSRDVGCFVLEYVNEKKAIESYKIHRKTQPIGLSFQFKGIEKRFKTLAEFEEKMIEWKDLFGLISFEPVKLHLPETLDEDEESLLRWLKKIIGNEDLVNQLYNKIVYQFGKETKQEVLVDPSIRKELTTWFKKKKKIHQGSEKQLSFEEFQGSLTYDDILEDENTSKVQTNQEQDTKDLKKEEIFVETTEEKIEKKVETTISQKLVENDELEPKNLLELEKEKEDLKREEEERERFQREEDEEREKRIKSSKIASQPSPPFSFSSPTAKRETFDTVDIEIETLESLWQTDILEGLTDKTEKFSVFVSTVEESEKLESKLQHAEHLLKLDITFDKNLPNVSLKKITYFC